MIVDRHVLGGMPDAFRTDAVFGTAVSNGEHSGPEIIGAITKRLAEHIPIVGHRCFHAHGLGRCNSRLRACSM
jgi:hypothetical protein